MEAAKDLLRRAVELDTAKRYSEALICYEEGIQNLLRSMHESRAGDEMIEMRRKAEGYLKRAEQVKKLVKAGEDLREKVQSITINEGATGYSYEQVFSEYLDSSVQSIVVEDPYIRARHQVHNFVRFCELTVRKCSKNLQTVELHTGGGEPDQQQQLDELASSLQRHGVALSVSYSQTLHDRQIRLSNGWIIKLGRGLDYFKRPQGQFSIGFSDYSLRECHETTIEIFHRLNTKRLK